MYREYSYNLFTFVFVILTGTLKLAMLMSIWCKTTLQNTKYCVALPFKINCPQLLLKLYHFNDVAAELDITAVHNRTAHSFDSCEFALLC